MADIIYREDFSTVTVIYGVKDTQESANDEQVIVVMEVSIPGEVLNDALNSLALSREFEDFNDFLNNYDIISDGEAIREFADSVDAIIEDKEVLYDVDSEEARIILDRLLECSDNDLDSDFIDLEKFNDGSDVVSIQDEQAGFDGDDDFDLGEISFADLEEDEDLSEFDEDSDFL